ncbi:acyltransferase [Aeromonas enteropelogenes]|uniref:acyltransferase n=1 Tax=Aeromonas enteropelogenes TaxID=29489 RepID=UPI00398A09E4
MNIIKLILDRTILKISKRNTFDCFGKIKQSTIKVKGENNAIYVHENVKIRNCEIIINGYKNTIIFHKNCDINNSRIFIDNIGGNITIGRDTSIGGAMIVSFEPYDISIGDDCMLSYGIEIRNTDSHKIISLDNGMWINKGKGVYIGDHVWISADCKILKGSYINDNSVIGANSLVSGAIPSNVIAIGQPAKVFKENISWNRESVIPKDENN